MRLYVTLKGSRGRQRDATRKQQRRKKKTWRMVRNVGRDETEFYVFFLIHMSISNFLKLRLCCLSH